MNLEILCSRATDKKMLAINAAPPRQLHFPSLLINGSDNELRELAEESSSDTKDILLSDEDDSIDLET